jgi:hypothetical protein
MLRKRKFKVNLRIVETDLSSFLPLLATSEEVQMYRTLIREFPEIEKEVLVWDRHSIGMSFRPENSKSKWRSLQDVYTQYLPEINRRTDHKAYELALINFIDDK